MTSGRGESSEMQVAGDSDELVAGVVPPFLWNLADRLPMGVLLLDGEGRILAANRAGARLLAVDTPSDGTQFFGEAAPFEGAEELGDRYREDVAEGSLDLEREVVVELPDGDHRVSLRLIGVQGGGDHEDRAMAVLQDRTELATERRRRKRAESLVSLEELAAGVAHEVNNPLSSIKAFAQLVRKETRDEEKRDLLALIVREADRVSKLITRNLSLVQDLEGQERQPVDLNDLVQEVVELRSYSLESADVELTCDLHSNLPPVHGSADDLRQVLVNLLVNAEEALTQVERSGQVIIRTRPSSAGVLLTVVDNGPGIPSERLEEIFEPFHTSKDDGTGLGLQICRSVVRDHGGEMWVESEEGEGAAFWVRLRRASENEGETSTVRRRADGGQSAAAADEEADGGRRPLDVLVVDDEPLVRRALQMSLEERGHRVTLAEDAFEGRERAEESPFDVAVLDVRMPGDGIQLREDLEEQHGMDGRTLLLTGDVSRARTREALEEGGPYLTKPFDFDEVTEAVERLAADD